MRMNHYSRTFKWFCYRPFVVNFIASFVEIGLDEVRDKGNLQGLSNKVRNTPTSYILIPILIPILID